MFCICLKDHVKQHAVLGKKGLVELHILYYIEKYTVKSRLQNNISKNFRSFHLNIGALPI